MTGPMEKSAANSHGESSYIESIGKKFATKYYDAVFDKPGAWPMERFFDEKSKLVFLQRGGGRWDHEMRGRRSIQEFFGRMRYVGCDVVVKSVDAIEVRPGWFAVLTVCDLRRPGERGPRKFIQSTIVKCTRYAQKKFTIVGSVFKYDDRVVDDIGPAAAAADPEDDDDDDVPTVAAAREKPANNDKPSVKQLLAGGGAARSEKLEVAARAPKRDSESKPAKGAAKKNTKYVKLFECSSFSKDDKQKVVEFRRKALTRSEDAVDVLKAFYVKQDSARREHDAAVNKEPPRDESDAAPKQTAEGNSDDHSSDVSGQPKRPANRRKKNQ